MLPAAAAAAGPQPVWSGGKVASTAARTGTYTEPVVGTKEHERVKVGGATREFVNERVCVCIYSLTPHARGYAWSETVLTSGHAPHPPSSRSACPRGRPLRCTHPPTTPARARPLTENA